MKDYAILLDGAFVLKRIGRARGSRAVASDVTDLAARIRANPALSGLTLLRIYWYDAPPATGNLHHPVSRTTINLGQSEVFKTATSLHDTLELQPDFALRMGEVSVPPVWRIRTRDLKEIAGGRPMQASDFKPCMEQKGVDLRIGLDIARLSLRQFVSTIVVATGDSDLVPAFKFARREGIRIYLDSLGFTSCKRALKAHVDLILETPPVPGGSALPQTPADGDGDEEDA